MPESKFGHMPEQMAESELSTEEQVATIWSLGGLSVKPRHCTGADNCNFCLVISALAAVLAGGSVANVAASRFGWGQMVVFAWRVAQFIVALAFITFSFSLIYYFEPDLEQQHWYWITPGSIIGVLLWVAPRSHSVLTFISSTATARLMAPWVPR